MKHPFAFKHHIIDDTLPLANYAQTALADLDNDGRLEYIVGQQNGTIFWYKCQSPERWERLVLGTMSPSDVGGAVLDVDGDGWVDFVAGGAWYQNSRQAGIPFTRHVFDPALNAVHDLAVADVNGDGKLDVITMSDQNSLRWYRIPEDPTQEWECHQIGKPVHAGLAVGDIDGDGDLDIVRTNVWFENIAGDGSRWVEHPVGPNTPPPPDFQPYFAFDATFCMVCDMDKDGKQDIVFTDAEIPGGKVWWMENLDGRGLKWQRHEIYQPVQDEPRRGAFHSLFVGDLDGDDNLDVFSCEMEAVPGDEPPRYYIWENLDSKGGAWKEHIILDANLGGHNTVVGDIFGRGKLDMVSKPWHANPKNALGGKMFIVYLENISS